MTFPLLLTPFEEYVLRDSTPSHPMEFFYRLTFDEPLDADAVAAASLKCFRRHPLLAARIDDRPGHRPRFALPFDAAHVGVLTGEGLDGLAPIPALDPARGPLARLFLVRRAGETREILAQFHHVACDGLGALAFIGDFCTLLDARLEGEPPPESVPVQRLLPGRGRYGLDSWKLLRCLPAQARGLEGVWKFLRHRPVRLTAHSGGSCTVRTHLLQRSTVAFTADEARDLRRTAAGLGVSLNELAAAALLEALLEAVTPAVSGRSRDVVRLSIPMNMRRAADRRLPAANVVSMVFLDRSSAEIGSPSLVTSLHEEMQLIKRLDLGMTFLFTLAVARWIPGGIAGLVADRSTAATALFTNLGRILTRSTERRGGLVKVGSRRLVAIEPLAPLRRGTALGMAAVEYGGTLAFTLRTDPSAVTAAATVALRDAFAARLQRHLPPANADAREPSVAEACA